MYLFISLCPRTPCSIFYDAGSRIPPPSINSTAVGNQTAVKQIDVVFNAVVSSSQGRPRLSQ